MQVIETGQKENTESSRELADVIAVWTIGFETVSEAPFASRTDSFNAGSSRGDELCLPNSSRHLWTIF